MSLTIAGFQIDTSKLTADEKVEIVLQCDEAMDLLCGELGYDPTKEAEPK